MDNLVSKLTVSIGFSIIVSATFMRQLASLCQAHMGKIGFLVFTALLMVGGGLAFFVFTLRNFPGFTRTLGIVAVVVCGLLFAWHIEIPGEKIHVLEYGVLGWFASRDLVKPEQRISSILLVLVFVGLVGLLDELFQAALPYRYFGWRDIAFDVLGGI